MKLIVGLGNPGKKYEGNRHNVGFMALDYVLCSNNDFMTARPSHDFKSEMNTWEDGTHKVIFLKPQTYMNDSGQALRVICNFYKMDFEKDLLVVHDELDLPFGTIRTSVNASPAGHNGIKSIIENLGTQNFTRLRIGIETRESRDQLPTEAFVLQNFSETEFEKLNKELLPNIRTEIEKFIFQ